MTEKQQEENETLYRVVYTSTATALFAQGALFRMLTEFRAKNKALDITGLLLHKNGTFMQHLEGPKKNVTSLMSSIKIDERHSGMVIPIEKNISEREFLDWSMGFANLDVGQSKNTVGYSEFLNIPLTADEFSENPSECIRLLKVFKENIMFG